MCFTMPNFHRNKETYIDSRFYNGIGQRFSNSGAHPLGGMLEEARMTPESRHTCAISIDNSLNHTKCGRDIFSLPMVGGAFSRIIEKHWKKVTLSLLHNEHHGNKNQTSVTVIEILDVM